MRANFLRRIVGDCVAEKLSQAKIEFKNPIKIYSSPDIVCHTLPAIILHAIAQSGLWEEYVSRNQMP